MPDSQVLEVPIQGMDCAECTRHVQRAIAGLPGVESVEVFLASEKALIRQQPGKPVDPAAIRQAVASAGYSVPFSGDQAAVQDQRRDLTSEAASQHFQRRLLALLGLVFGAVLFIVVVGEWLGLFETITERVPWPLGAGIVLLFGFPIFRNVLRAARRGQVIAHTLMSLGAFAALAVGEWATAAVVVFFMRVGDYVEGFTAERARRAVKDLNALAPETARLLRDGQEVVVPVEQVRVGDIVVVRPGEKIPVDGQVIAGQATVDQATITGEAMPVEAGPGSAVFAATLAHLGSLRVRATQVGPDTTFGRVIRLVENAEAQRGEVQRLADRFSAYYLPLVAAIAGLTFLVRRDPLATAAVLVVACSCSFALATPIAILASIGASARHGLLVKGGKYLESLAKADVLLIDKTGTLTLGKPRITDILTRNEHILAGEPKSGPRHPTESHIQVASPTSAWDASSLLQLAASAERYSEHPLAEALRRAALDRSLPLAEPHDFQVIPGMGVQARVNGSRVTIGNRRLLGTLEQTADVSGLEALESQGKSMLYVEVDGQLAGALAAEDTPRPEVPAALAEVRRLGIEKIELLTGDNRRSAAALSERLGLDYRAELLPEDKIAIVQAYQARGHTVVMVGDGVNDAPALAQADVGIAMGAAGSPVAIEAAHIALLRDDWQLVPHALRIAQRTMGVVKMNIGFTALYNLAGISLAALGLLPPIFAAAAQSLPDLGILANASRLLRQK